MFYDAHFHLSLLENPAEILKEMMLVGYSGESSACFPEYWEKELKLLKGNKQIRLALGVHPSRASEISAFQLKKLESLLTENKEISVGECGLDKRFPGYKDIQESVFRFQVQLAKRLNRPLILHVVSDYVRLFQILKEEAFPGDLKILLHRFSGDASILKWSSDFYAFFSNPKHKEIISEDKLLIETDADNSFVPKNTNPKETVQKMLSVLELKNKEYFTIVKL